MDSEAWKTIGTAITLCIVALGLVKHYWDTRQKAAELAAKNEERRDNLVDKRDERVASDLGRFRKELLDLIEHQGDELITMGKKLDASRDQCEALRQECHQLRVELARVSAKLAVCEARLNEGVIP